MHPLARARQIRRTDGRASLWTDDLSEDFMRLGGQEILRLLRVTSATGQLFGCGLAFSLLCDLVIRHRGMTVYLP